ncbi:MAG: transcriptional regulator, GntR family [Frankiales bacterium]|nr:transcriptional regulator, GntR family [Frankiales bacterium]
MTEREAATSDVDTVRPLRNVVAERPLRDVVAEALREGIETGRLQPGTRIREEQLAEDFGVSRVPVREALQALGREGYLVLAPRRGATVATPSPAAALGVMEIRRALEVLAARRAAAVRGGACAKELRRVLSDGARAVRSGKHGELPGLVDRFHALVADASGNVELIDMLANLRARVRWMFAVDLDKRSEVSWEDHAQICNAILAGDTSLAAELMDVHVERDEQLYRARSTDA